MTGAVPSDVMGLWRREVKTAPGFRDETTQVFWLQTSCRYADLRVRADRPGPRAGDGLSAYSDEELVALAQTQGFAGPLEVSGGVCLWRRDLDCQPPGPLPDEGRYAVAGDVLIEDGIHRDYQEIWRRVPGVAGPFSSFRLTREDGRDGLLVTAGRHMIEFVARPGPAPQGESLAVLVAQELAGGRRPAAEALLDTQIRYAVLDKGVWTVRLSSMPWLEDRPMWSPGAAHFSAEGAFEVTDERGRMVGTLLDATGPIEQIAALLGGGAQAEAAADAARSPSERR